MTREEFQKQVSDRFQNTDSGFGNMTQRERILLHIASNLYDSQVKNCSIPYVMESVCSCSKGKGIDHDEDGKTYCIDCGNYLEQTVP